MQNTSLNKWREHQASLGAWINLPDLHITETLARSGLDWLCFDLQHGLMDYHDLARILPGLNGQPVTPLVRVAANSGDQIGKVLDVGAQGVIVPMVNNVDEAKKAVAACFYPPKGLRSCGPMRPVMQYGFEYLAKANDNVACVVMIETLEGLENVEAIAAVEGIDGVFIGPVDLCYGLGITPGDFGHAKFQDALMTIIHACKTNNIAAGMFGYSPELAKQAIDSGFTFVSAGTDISFFRAGMAQSIATAKGEDPVTATAKAGY